MITMYVLGLAWIAVSLMAAAPIGRGIRGPVQLATVIPLYPSAASAGEEPGRRGPLPAHLSPRAELPNLAASWRRLRPNLVTHGWLAGLVAAAVLVYVLSVLQGLTPVTAIR